MLRVNERIAHRGRVDNCVFFPGDIASERKIKIYQCFDTSPFIFELILCLTFSRRRFRLNYYS